jgi:thiol-disulfide isomerase/thioredoxin
MIFLHIDPTTSKKSNLFNRYVREGKLIFVLFYMEGCGPCNATRPEWKKLEHVLAHKHKNNDNIVIVDVDQDVLKSLKYIRNQPKGFPTMQHIRNKGHHSEDYEDSDISKKDRTIDSFVEWIEHHMKNNMHTHRMRGGKWSLKYKRSINCKHPKGFSQRQHCKYGRRGGKGGKTRKRRY